MDDTSFDVLLNEAKKFGHHSKKLSTIETAVTAGQKISSAQAAQLVGLIAHDSVKLELAKMLFPYATDKPIYAITVSKAIVHSSTRDELGEFVREYKP